jgi:ribosome-associated protein
LDKNGLLSELQFKGLRSSGAGGQNVNKVASKVELSFNVRTSQGLSDEEKNRILEKLSSRLTREDVLILQSDTTRSQHKNKKLAIERFFDLLEKAVKVPKRRKKTKPGPGAVQKRLKAKKLSAEKKSHRQKPDLPTE